MTEAEVLELINNFIVENGNNEITADVLRPILVAMLEQPNDFIGVLSQLQTSDQSNLVNAINEVYNMVGGITDFGVQLHSGTGDPNVTPPAEYNIADFYIQRDIDNNPIDLWQYNGLGWVKQTVSGSENVFAEDLNYTGSSVFTIPSEVKIISVSVNSSGPLPTSQYTRVGNSLTIVYFLEEDDIVNVRGITI